jgi:hypothetical protein
VLATPDDRVAPGLQRIKTFAVADPDTTIIAYRNPAHWQDTAVLQPHVKDLAPLSPRPGCTESGLLCANFTPVARLRVAGGVRSEQWSGTTLDVKLDSAAVHRVLMLSQLYRPGWRARLSDGRTVPGYRLLGGFTGFDLPPNASSATISFHPTGRIVLTIVTWATIFFCLVAIGGLLIVRRSDARNPMVR